jgi:error-prone DNA polymerase
LQKLATEAVERMFDGNVPEAYTTQITHEMRLIGELGYAPYFLTVYSIVREARRRGSLSGPRLGRQHASASCSASPRSTRSKHELLFERFVSGERREPPTSTSTSSMSAARRSSSGSTRPMAVIARR